MLDDLVFSMDDTGRGEPGSGSRDGSGAPEASHSSPADPAIAGRRVDQGAFLRMGRATAATFGV
jgi:hypothetical protein